MFDTWKRPGEFGPHRPARFPSRDSESNFRLVKSRRSILSFFVASSLLSAGRALCDCSCLHVSRCRWMLVPPTHRLAVLVDVAKEEVEGGVAAVVVVGVEPGRLGLMLEMTTCHHLQSLRKCPPWPS